MAATLLGEVDAMPMAELKRIVNNFIVRTINAEENRVAIWHETEQGQAAAREAIEVIISDVGKGGYGLQFAVTEI